MPAAMIGLHLGQRRIPRVQAAGRWLLTLAATVLSTYALDAVATGAGLALAGSGLLDGVGRTGGLTFLVASYVAWGAGMWTNLQANWDLLERTGTSTNVLSKAAYEMLKRAGSKPRWRRVATDVGYAGTELAKETPYYAGAVGAALLSDEVSAFVAIVFLGGANLGAALYEMALAQGVRLFLRRRPAAYASFDTEWCPRAYLREYYGRIEADERHAIAYFAAAFAAMPPGQRVLVYGAGPTLHHVFLAAAKASEIHLADYLPGNLAEIRRWLSRDPAAHDWRPFVAYTLQCEGIGAPSDAQIAFSSPATSICSCRDSTTQGPAMRNSGWSSPTSNPHSFTARPRSTRPARPRRAPRCRRAAGARARPSRSSRTADGRGADST